VIAMNQFIACDKISNFILTYMSDEYVNENN
jgi:hypothetical protein